MAMVGQSVSGVALAPEEQEPTSRRQRGRPRAATDAARRAEILAQARLIFLERGYAGTTTELVATSCHISKQTLYRLFPSKTELFRALVVDHRSTMLKLPLERSDLPPAEAIAAIFRVGLSASADRERLAFLDFAMREARTFPEIGQMVRQDGGEASRALLAGWLEAQHAAGILTIEDADSAAHMLMDIIFGAMMHLPGGPPDGPQRAQRDAHLRRCIRIFIDGVRPREPAAPAAPHA
ncbi:TetR/AcrR family transcriptional regulator [Azorhizobium sp. AG788]|uniref:TetR/AcrR family transcriptional regulator n=1 Tax=Azorhizobium sp. AG788 TaxID=2183897 RepID=UPI00313991C2